MLILTDTQEVDLAVAFTDKKNNPATVDGAPTWSSSDPTIVTVVASADGLTAVATAVGPLGQAQISATGDADRGEGVRPVTAVLDITVQASDAVVAAVNAGAPREQA